MLSTQSQEIALQRHHGATVTALSGQYGVCHQRVSQIGRAVTALVDRIELDLMVARKTDEVVAYLVPYHNEAEWRTAVAFGDHLVQRLRERGLRIRVETRRASNGVALLLEDRTEFCSGGNA
jgi:hypothetical protein